MHACDEVRWVYGGGARDVHELALCQRVRGREQVRPAVMRRLSHEY